MSDVFGPAMLSVSQGFSSFTQFLPRLSDVRKAGADDTAMAGDVRMGEVAAVAMTLAVGVISSSLTGSPIPAYTAIGVSLVLVCTYEYALRGERPFEGKLASVTSLYTEATDEAN